MEESAAAREYIFPSDREIELSTEPWVFKVFADFLDHRVFYPSFNNYREARGPEWLERINEPLYGTNPTAPLPTLQRFTGETFGIKELEDQSDAYGEHSFARRLLACYILGVELGASIFKDRIMNEIVKGFRPDKSVSPDFIEFLIGK